MIKLFSIDEFRVSMLTICLFVVMGIAIFDHINGKDLSDSWRLLIEAFIYAISGVNIVHGLSALFANPKKVIDELKNIEKKI